MDYDNAMELDTPINPHEALERNRDANKFK